MTARTCQVCDASIDHLRAKAEVCGAPCRRERSRLRRLAAGKPEHGYADLAAYRARKRRSAPRLSDFCTLRSLAHPPSKGITPDTGTGAYAACPHCDSNVTYLDDDGDRFMCSRLVNLPQNNLPTSSPLAVGVAA